VVLLPFVLRCLELQEPTILNEVLEKVPFLHNKFEYRQMKDQILPRMLQLLLGTSGAKIKVQVLMGINRIFEIFDKTTITDVILVAFEKLSKMDRTPPICMCLLGCYDAMSKQLGPKMTAEKVLPLVVPMLAEESLSNEQWETQVTVCKKLMQRVELARRKEYEIRKENQTEVGEVLRTKDEVKNKAPSNIESQPLDFDSLLFQGTNRTSHQAVQEIKPAAAPFVQPRPPAAPPPTKDLFESNFSSLLDAPTATGNGFDPFSGNVAPVMAATTTPAHFDPFSAAPSTVVPSPVATSAPAWNTQVSTPLNFPQAASDFNPLLAPAPQLTSNVTGFSPGNAYQTSSGSSAMPNFTDPAARSRNMAYDPFAEIESRQQVGSGPATASQQRSASGMSGFGGSFSFGP